MLLQRFCLRFEGLAFWLSLLALCSALMAPASALAQDMRSGQWSGLCGASTGAASGQDGHAEGEGAHCPLCALPGLAPASGASPSCLSIGPSVQVLAALPAARVAATAERPAIRAPPVLS